MTHTVGSARSPGTRSTRKTPRTPATAKPSVHAVTSRHQRKPRTNAMARCANSCTSGFSISATVFTVTCVVVWWDTRRRSCSDSLCARALVCADRDDNRRPIRCDEDRRPESPPPIERGERRRQQQAQSEPRSERQTDTSRRPTLRPPHERRPPARAAHVQPERAGNERDDTNAIDERERVTGTDRDADVHGAPC